MLPDSPQVAKWQRTLDRTFPRGAICSWDVPGGDPDTVYRIPRIEVTGMANLDPMVRLPVDGEPRVLGPWRVLSYEQLPSGNYRVSFDDDPGRTMTWSPNVPERAAYGMVGQRQQLIKNAPQGGRATYEGP